MSFASRSLVNEQRVKWRDIPVGYSILGICTVKMRRHLWKRRFLTWKAHEKCTLGTPKISLEPKHLPLAKVHHLNSEIPQLSELSTGGGCAPLRTKGVNCLENLAWRTFRNRQGNWKMGKIDVSGNKNLIFLASTARKKSRAEAKGNSFYHVLSALLIRHRK